MIVEVNLFKKQNLEEIYIYDWIIHNKWYNYSHSQLVPQINTFDNGKYMLIGQTKPGERYIIDFNVVEISTEKILSNF